MFLFIRYWFIYYILLNCNSKKKRNHIHRLKMAQYLCAPICIWKTTVNSLTCIWTTIVNSLTEICMCRGLIDNFGNNMLLWLSDTLGTAAHIVKLLTVSLRSTGFRNVGWVGLGQQIWTHVHL